MPMMPPAALQATYRWLMSKRVPLLFIILLTGLCILSNNKLYIRTEHIDHIYYPGLNGVSFQDFEKAFSLNGFEIQAKYMLMSPPYYVPEDVATQIAPVFAEAMLAHFAGDETISAEANAAIQSVSEISPDLAGIILGLYTDLPPKDNEMEVDLK